MTTRLAFRVGSILGIPIRVHLLFLVFMVVETVMTPGYTRPRTALSLAVFFGVLFLTVVLHELGHCLMARRHRGRAHDILVWILGGLAHVDYPRSPRSQVAVSLAGIGVNILLAGLAGAMLFVQGGAFPGLPYLGVGMVVDAENWTFARDVLLSVWNLNLALAVFNLLPGYPLDGGMAVECLLWKRLGRPKARLAVLASGAVIGFGLFLGGFAKDVYLMSFVGIWVLWQCGRGYQELREKGLEEDLLLGQYDFSQGQTSLDASAPPPDKGERKREREEERRVRAERKREEAERAAREAARERVDALLDRIATDGMNSLSSEERAFLVEESKRLKASRTRG